MSCMLILYVVPCIMIYHKIIYGFYFHINKENFFFNKQIISELKAKQLGLLIQFNSICIPNSVIEFNYMI